MPIRTVANRRHRQLFADISALKGISLTTKNTEALSINIHGSFALFDKHWPVAADHKNETMIALEEDNLGETRGEPSVHFHVDWNRIRWACIRKRHLDLISTDYEIVFAEEPDPSSRKFWFYLRETSETRHLVSKWGLDWISLELPINVPFNNVFRRHPSRNIIHSQFN